MGIIGGTLTGPLIFILPPLFYRRISRMELQYNEHKRNDDTNDLMMGNEDGDDDNINLDQMQTYGTFTHTLSTRRTNILCTDHFIDSMLSAFVIVFGIIATFTSTYFNLLNISNFKNFWTPCIYNITNVNVIKDL